MKIDPVDTTVATPPEMTQEELLRETHRLTAETRGIMKKTMVLSAIRLGITIIFLVAPLVAGLFFLPKLLSSGFEALGNSSVTSIGDVIDGYSEVLSDKNEPMIVEGDSGQLEINRLNSVTDWE